MPLDWASYYGSVFLLKLVGQEQSTLAEYQLFN